MNIKLEVQKEHSKTQAHKIVTYVGNNPTRFKILVETFVAGPYRITQRAVWPLSLCVERYPELVKPHLPLLIKSLTKVGIHDAVKRNILRFLQFIPIPTNLQGKVVTLCFDFLQDSKEPIAVRVFAMSVLAKLAKTNPDLTNEIIFILNDNLPYASAGFLSRAKSVLKQLQPKGKPGLL